MKDNGNEYSNILSRDLNCRGKDMQITGKKVFKRVYITSLIFHTLFIIYQLSQSNTLDRTYLILTASSISAMTLILMSLKKDKGDSI